MTLSHLGLPQDEWPDTVELIEKLRRLHAGSIIEPVLNDTKDEVIMIYIQLREQRELYQKYGEVIQIDGTYKLNMIGMPLYSIMVEDNFGVGQPVCFMLVDKETTQRLTQALKMFATV